ncbi:hypothetical protein FACS189449_09000 [Alphaproteobacteria bacterium]|nr:hypothetical protein FACS189449_09000 [Alphaproteobacteria bacterium]
MCSVERKSDFKSRGFAITSTHLKHEKRIENLILILTIAIYWAVSVGTTPRKQENFSKKNFEDQKFHTSSEDYDI